MRYFKYFFSVALLLFAFFVISSQFKKVYYDIPSLFREADKSLLVYLAVFQALNYTGGGWLFKILSDIAGFKVKLIDTLKIAISGVAGAHIAPLFGGSIATFYSFKKLKIPSEIISFLIPSWTFFIYLSYILVFIIALVALPSLFLEFISLRLIAAILAAAVLVAINSLFLFKRKGRNLSIVAKGFFKIINRFTAFFGKKYLVKDDLPEKLISGFYRQLDFLLENKKRIPQIMFSSFLFYLGDILTLYFAFLVFGFHPNLIVLILGYAFSLVFTLLALVPATPGVMEASLVVVFVKLGFPAHVVLFSSLLFRLFTYWLPLPVGLFLYSRIKNVKL